VRRAAVALVLALVLPACGSTVQQNASGGLPPGAAGFPADGLSVPAADGAAGAASGPGEVGGGAFDPSDPSASASATGAGSAAFPGTDPGPGAPGTGGSATGPAGGGGAGAAAPSGAVGPGITADKVHIGVAYFPDAAAANSSLGADSNAGDQRDYYNAVIDDVNSRGGVAGRKMVPIYHEYKTASSEPFDAQSEQACNRWTKDNKVFAIAFRGRVLQECARKAGALMLAGDGEAGPTYASLPNLVDPDGIRLERLGAATVLGLNRDRYFQPTPEWPTGNIGVITWQDRSFEYGVREGYVPALASLRLEPTETAYIAVPQNVGAIADASAAVSNAVLRFRSQGVDHVLIQDGPAGVFGLGGLTLLFLNNAKSQNYFPRYGFNANNVPGFEVYPADQQHGMLAVDFSDYEPEKDAGIAPNAARERCFAIMKKRGVATSEKATAVTAAAACDEVWFLETLLRKAPEPTLQGALQAAAGLGTSYRSPYVYGTRFGPNRRDGAELARNARFDDACACMRFTTAPYAPA
jgi:hypothetical protein